ncbi:MAG: hypothetical protein ABS75_21240 [Pelagibacterium sp. SCN 63-23]|nr:MAG: hypothetical protein ABS75_21240 [Pelagibacterium sp. SCN 63-23]
MVAILAIEPVSTGTTGFMDHRYRPAMGERTVLPDSTQKSPASARPGDRGREFPEDRHQDRAEPPAEPARSSAANFAAAVIAGALPPTPASMEELIRRIGASEIPEESQARLRDLLA